MFDIITVVLLLLIVLFLDTHPSKQFYNDDHIINLMTGDMFGKLNWHSPYSIKGKNDFQILSSFIKPKSVVLDFGCGVGGTAIRLAKELNCTVYGLNISEKQKAIMDIEIKKRGLVNQVFCVLYDGKTFPNFLLNKKFDAVIFQESMCHVVDKYNTLKQIKSLLKTNGVVFGQDWFKLNDSEFIEKTDYYYVTKLETPKKYVKYLKDLGFKNVQFIDLKTKSKDLYALFPKNTNQLQLKGRIEMGGAAMSKAFHNGDFTIGLLIAKS
jgi:2-polyprenyl-3-methyl-5-hydroxy-6-metoxy-1,4-benzoquinol methylase